MAAAADSLAAARDVLDENLGISLGLGLAVLVSEPDDRVGIADIDVRRLRPARIERDPEWPAESAGKDADQLGLSIPVGVAQHLDASGHALGDEDVAIGSGHDLSWVLQAVGEFGDLEALRRRGQAPSGRGTGLGNLLAEGVA